MSTQSRMEALEKAGLVHPRPAAVTAGLFCSEYPFFLAADKVQVKYEMLRAVAVDRETIVAAAAAPGGALWPRRPGRAHRPARGRSRLRRHPARGASTSLDAASRSEAGGAGCWLCARACRS